ncbi:DNA-binding CsgD family transcriptional regulator [Chryseobacterium defluvii]|uniref:DNA-binding CsgD family transcriptional regulator n=1 Tax=Chryseobacterium defluvii TaxID=160396 RepID=A0A840KIX6_9FLAO|nr:LuxR C-terminal-related transcriptional regulator [Chryseobacterium defluvii]MBB4807877.1 DNA-binding CsgD family transcriptional regulator [Chryseobacterium defluvii]
MVLDYNFKKVFCFFFFTGFSFYFAQVGMYSTPEIDSLQKKEFSRLQDIGDFKGIVIQEQELIRKSGELHYTKGEITGYLNIASSLVVLNRNKESMYFLEMAERKLNSYNDANLRTRLNIVYGKNYSALGLKRQSNERLNRAIRFVGKISDPEERKKRLYLIYTWKRTNFVKMQMMDSVLRMERKSLQLSPNPELYAEIAERNLYDKKPDSAEYYLGKALSSCQKCPVRQKASVLMSFGKLYIEKKEYEKALQYFFESLAISRKAGFKKMDRDAYKLIFETYKLIDNAQGENEYLRKYTILNDSLNKVEKEILSIPVEKLLNEQAENEKKSKNNLYYMIIGIILGGVAIVIIIFNIYKRSQKEKDILIDQKEKETDTLKKKLDTVYEEVVQLAVNGDPLFITKFKETYPEFYNNLIHKYPQLTANDIRFCAMMKLNFSNKEIAQYGNMSIRTVESKKYRLRKKMKIESDIDFSSWMSSLEH